MTPIRMAFPLMRKAKASSPRCSTSQRATIAPWKPISTRSVVSNGPGRINQAFSVRSSTWPKSQLRADWAIMDWNVKSHAQIYVGGQLALMTSDLRSAADDLWGSGGQAVESLEDIRRQNTNVAATRSEEHTSELQSIMRISYAVFCLKKKKK